MQKLAVIPSGRVFAVLQASELKPLYIFLELVDGKIIRAKFGVRNRVEQLESRDIRTLLKAAEEAEWKLPVVYCDKLPGNRLLEHAIGMFLIRHRQGLGLDYDSEIFDFAKHPLHMFIIRTSAYSAKTVISDTAKYAVCNDNGYIHEFLLIRGERNNDTISYSKIGRYLREIKPTIAIDMLKDKRRLAGEFKLDKNCDVHIHVITMKSGSPVVNGKYAYSITYPTNN